MRYKKHKASYRLLSLLLLVTGLFFAWPFKAGASDKPVHILVVYPEEADRISGEDGPAALGRVLVSLGYET